MLIDKFSHVLNFQTSENEVCKDKRHYQLRICNKKKNGDLKRSETRNFLSAILKKFQIWGNLSFGFERTKC